MPRLPKPIACMEVTWTTAEGHRTTEYFCTREYGKKVWGSVYGELSYVSICEDPRQGLLRFLSHAPLSEVILRERY